MSRLKIAAVAATAALPVLELGRSPYPASRLPQSRRLRLDQFYLVEEGELRLKIAAVAATAA